MAPEVFGLGQYEEGFRDNKIDFDVLADLTDGDLEKLGVPLGDRRRLLKAIPERGSERLPVLLPEGALGPASTAGAKRCRPAAAVTVRTVERR